METQTRQFVGRSRRLPAWEGIFARVAARHGLPLDIVTGRSQIASVVNARYDVIRECFVIGYSASAIGRLLGRDPTSVHHALKKMGILPGARR